MAQQRGPDPVKVARAPGSDAFAAVPSVRSALLNPGRGPTKPSGRTLQHLMRSMAIPTACDSSGACPGAPPGTTWRCLAETASVCMAAPAVSMCSMHLAWRHRLPGTAAGLLQTLVQHECVLQIFAWGVCVQTPPSHWG